MHHTSGRVHGEQQLEELNLRNVTTAESDLQTRLTVRRGVDPRRPACEEGRRCEVRQKRAPRVRRVESSRDLLGNARTLLATTPSAESPAIA